MHTTQDTTRETKQDKAKKEEPSKFKEGKEIKSYLNTVAGYITGDGANVKLKVSFLSAAQTGQVVKLRIQSGFENFDKIQEAYRVCPLYCQLKQ